MVRMDIDVFQQMAKDARQRRLGENPMSMENQVVTGVFVRDWSPPPGDYVGREVHYRGRWYCIQSIDSNGCTGNEVDGLDKAEIPVTTDDFDRAYSCIRSKRNF